MGARFAVLTMAALSVVFAAEHPKGEGNVAPYYPTPVDVAARMLEAGELQPGELHYDLGSGDGRFVILAARDFGARSVGVELDSKLVASSRRRIAEMGLEDSASIIEQDLFTVDLSKPDLITVYLLPRALSILRPLLEEQGNPGLRVVSHDFRIQGWDPDETIMLDKTNEIDGLPHTIYIYRR